MIPIANPFFATMGGKPDRFFLGELEALWLQGRRAEAQAILDAYKALRFNHIVVGPIIANGYDRVFADTDWHDKPEVFADFLDWLRSNGVEFTLALLPTMGPWFKGYDAANHGIGFGWDLDLIERDLTPFCQHPRIQALVRRTMLCYEEYGPISNMVACFQWARRMFPKAKRIYHNPPGHLSPANSNEHEEQAHRDCAKAGMTGMMVQCHPPDDVGPNAHFWAMGADGQWRNGEGPNARTPLEQAVYDVHDIARRYRGDHGAPWGPIYKWAEIDGVWRETTEPLDCEYAEGLAHAHYHTGGHFFDLSKTWGDAMRAIPGVVHSLDGA